MMLGALSVLCDINEYLKCVKEFKLPLVNRIFETLKSLCNLLYALPKELNKIINQDELVIYANQASNSIFKYQ